MKKVLAVVIAVAFISIGAVSSNAQVPNIQVYFDDLLQETQADCADHFLGETDQLNVVMNNFNMFVSSVEFEIQYPAVGFVRNADVHLPGAIFLGTSNSGVSISYPLPQNGFDPLICMRVDITWICDDCVTVGNNVPIIVLPHSGTGLLRAIEWQTFRSVDGVGMTSLLCPLGVSTEETSWGQIKALYN